MLENATRSDVTVASFGSWRSPIDSDLIATDTIRQVDVLVDGEDLYWIENRPKEGGRFVLVKHVRGGTDHDVTPTPFNARSRVHEYGGGAVLVDHGVVFFTNFADQKLYRQNENGMPRPISQASQCRYADATVDTIRNRLICVREDHGGSDGLVINSIVAIALDGIKGEQVLFQGHDFCSARIFFPAALNRDSVLLLLSPDIDGHEGVPRAIRFYVLNQSFKTLGKSVKSVARFLLCSGGD